MPNQHKTKLLGWHPSSAEDSAWVRAEGERRGSLKAVLDEMLREYVASRSGGNHSARVATTPPAPTVAEDEQPQQAAKSCKHRNMRMAKGICPDCHQPVGYK